MLKYKIWNWLNMDNLKNNKFLLNNVILSYYSQETKKSKLLFITY